MKRKIAFILILALSLTVVSSCAENEVSLMNFIPTEEFSLDLNNKVVTIGMESNSDDDMPSIFEHAENTVMYDSILKRLEQLGDKYNCSIEITPSGYGKDMITNMMTLAATGDPTVDIVFGHNSNIMGHLAVGGILYPLTELKEYLDYENSEKFGSAGLIEVAMVQGIPYAVQPVQWAGFTNSFAFYITWNRDLFNRFAMPDLHEYYENDTWTFDTFENLFKTYETIAEEEIDLAYIQKQFFTYSAMIANGVKFCNYDGSQYYSDFDSTNSYNAIDWSLNLFNKYEDIMFFDDYAYGYEDYAEERVMMMPTNAKNLTQYIPYESDFNFGVMPFPCGPDSVYGQWASFVENIRGFGISHFSDIPDASAIILNELCDPFTEISTENGLKDYYREQVFFTDLDTEIFLESGKNIRAFYTAQGMAIYDFMKQIKEATSVAQLIETHKAPIEALVMEQIRPNYEKYIYEHLDS